MRNTKLFTAVAITIGSLSVNTSHATQCENIEGIYENIKSKYEDKYSVLQSQVESIDFVDPSKFEAAINFKIDTKWKMEDFSFDVPVIKWNMKEMKFDIVQTRMERKDMSFDVPEVVMVRKHLFDIPEFRGLKIKMKPVYGKRPEIRSKRVHIKTDIPVFEWETTSIKTKIPEIYSKRVTVKTKIPHFKLIEVRGELKKSQKEADQISSQFEVLASQQEQEMSGVKKSTFECISNQIIVAQDEAVSNIDKSISDLESTIAEMRNAGHNPVNINGNNLIEILDTLKQQRSNTISQFELALVDFKAEMNLQLAQL